MATTTYYFDGHNSISDPASVWSNESNAFNGNNTDSASTTTSFISNEYLVGDGTNAPTSGPTITQVRARIDGGSAGHAYGSYTTLIPPTGGWSWNDVNLLSVYIVGVDAGGGTYGLSAPIYSGGVEELGVPEVVIGSFFGTYNVYKVDVEVTYDDPDAELTNIVSISNVVSITL